MNNTYFPAGNNRFVINPEKVEPVSNKSEHEIRQELEIQYEMNFGKKPHHFTKNETIKKKIEQHQKSLLAQE